MLIYIVVDEDNVPIVAYRDVKEAHNHVEVNEDTVGYDAIPYDSEVNTIFLLLDKDNIALAVFDNEDEAADFDDETEVSEGYYIMELK